ncbi:MAG: orotate phosphoribosyltransferase [Gracilibacteraceae bacterium]|nr:orotate phosphoribosyltransferase [Gracilibacteraceae bacterium]
MKKTTGDGALCSQFLDFMIQSEVLCFGDFILKSGRKAPYFINTGMFSTGGQLVKLGKFYAKLIQNSVRGDSYGIDEKPGEAALAAINQAIKAKFDVLFGPAYKGIPLVTATAGELAAGSGLDMPYAFNRKEEKDHGDGKRILGYTPQKGDRVALVEDVVTAGTSAREIRALFKDMGLGAEITALYVSVDRLERGTGETTAIGQIRATGVEVYAIATAADIIDYLENAAAGGQKVADAQKHAENMRLYLKMYGIR